MMLDEPADPTGSVDPMITRGASDFYPRRSVLGAGVPELESRAHHASGTPPPTSDSVAVDADAVVSPADDHRDRGACIAVRDAAADVVVLSPGHQNIAVPASRVGRRRRRFVHPSDDDVDGRRRRVLASRSAAVERGSEARCREQQSEVESSKCRCRRCFFSSSSRTPFTSTSSATRRDTPPRSSLTAASPSRIRQTPMFVTLRGQNPMSASIQGPLVSKVHQTPYPPDSKDCQTLRSARLQD